MSFVFLALIVSCSASSLGFVLLFSFLSLLYFTSFSSFLSFPFQLLHPAPLKNVYTFSRRAAHQYVQAYGSYLFFLLLVPNFSLDTAADFRFLQQWHISLSTLLSSYAEISYHSPLQYRPSSLSFLRQVSPDFLSLSRFHLPLGFSFSSFSGAVTSLLSLLCPVTFN